MTKRHRTCRVSSQQPCQDGKDSRFYIVFKSYYPFCDYKCTVKLWLWPVEHQGTHCKYIRNPRKSTHLPNIAWHDLRPKMLAGLQSWTSELQCQLKLSILNPALLAAQAACHAGLPSQCRSAAQGQHPSASGCCTGAGTGSGSGTCSAAQSSGPHGAGRRQHAKGLKTVDVAILDPPGLSRLVGDQWWMIDDWRFGYVAKVHSCRPTRAPKASRHEKPWPAKRTGPRRSPEPHTAEMTEGEQDEWCTREKGCPVTPQKEKHVDLRRLEVIQMSDPWIFPNKNSPKRLWGKHVPQLLPSHQTLPLPHIQLQLWQDALQLREST